MSAPTFVLDSSTEELSILVNDTGVLRAQNPQAPNNVNPGVPFQFMFDIENERASMEKGKYIVLLDGQTLKESDVFDIGIGQTLNIVVDVPAFPESERGKLHKIRADVYRRTS